MKNLIGTAPDQIPTNRNLGQAAYWDIPQLSELIKSFLGQPVDISSPASSTSPGKKGQITVNEDGSYIYICYAENEWCRVQAGVNW